MYFALIDGYKQTNKQNYLKGFKWKTKTNASVKKTATYAVCVNHSTSSSTFNNDIWASSKFIIFYILLKKVKKNISWSIVSH